MSLFVLLLLCLLVGWSKGNSEERRSLNSLRLIDVNRGYELDENKEYDIKFFEATLERIRGNADWPDYYDTIGCYFNTTWITTHKTGGNKYTFEQIAGETLFQAEPTIFMDLVKFHIANFLNKQVLHYLAVKSLWKPQDGTSTEVEKFVVGRIVKLLEDSIYRRSAPYVQVRAALDRLKVYLRGRLTQRIRDEEAWIEQKIFEAFS
ncbi:hypothetical protein OESDEN_12990 [Oesophagostomum dentatum]|uniref:Uncharacterized protein n=1 Tax=Oesophagostomum dentatum TaxID=61180 RepID=A0A0B1SVN4_OESDE|nr:hypothetical protein OESDEN_12990 [Oesophagostomum dentatum]